MKLQEIFRILVEGDTEKIRGDPAEKERLEKLFEHIRRKLREERKERKEAGH